MTRHINIVYYYYLHNYNSIYHVLTKSLKILLPFKSRTKSNENTKAFCPLRNKMNKNLFTSFITPQIIGSPTIILLCIES
ncbi:ATP synthase subunit a [Manis javanica]|nr:ATP synthase subunit a [Manis javanica]